MKIVRNTLALTLFLIGFSLMLLGWGIAALGAKVGIFEYKEEYEEI